MRFIRLDENNKVVSVRHGDAPVEGELVSVNGELGDVMQQDGTFATPITEPVAPQPTLEDKINYIYYKQMGVIA